jgi:Tfp pilus assembly protein PilO
MSDPWSTWANWGKLAIELLAIIFACGFGYAELQQVKRDVETQKQEIKAIRTDYLPREIFSLEMRNTREALQEVKETELRTQEIIRKFK